MRAVTAALFTFCARIGNEKGDPMKRFFMLLF